MNPIKSKPFLCFCFTSKFLSRNVNQSWGLYYKPLMTSINNFILNKIDRFNIFSALKHFLPYFRLSLFPTLLIIPLSLINQALQLDILITFVNTFWFNYDCNNCNVVCFAFRSLVINLIYLKQLVLL
jgi:hypothetical protein